MNRLEHAIGVVLRVGTVASSSLLAAGLVLALAGYRDAVARALLEVGLVILLATPATRVVVSVVEYVRERDWTFVVLTLVVLLALGASVAAAYL
ncbi:MAG TPA: DUF1634 domain-containing protein [Vicinamibacterales bacterium]|jgi:uncharacterized membrane protein|nr:DUF1634 domain-containing protein [Vicinamibacterales bacterium]